jgi:hypothetical protein
MARLRLVGYWSWLLATGLLAAVAGLLLAWAIAEAGAVENRAPALNVIVAALAFCAGLAALGSPIKRLRGSPPAGGPWGWFAALWGVLLIFLELLVEYGTVGRT